MNSSNHIIKLFVLSIGIFFLGCASTTDSTQTENKPATISNTNTTNASNPELRSMPSVPVADDGWGMGYKKIVDGKEVSLDGFWYTKKYSAKANTRSVELKSPSFMESSCRRSVLKENSKRVVESALSSLSSDIKPEKVQDVSSKIVKEQSKNFEISGCIATSAEKTFSECECALSFKPEGGKETLLKQLN